MDASFTVRFDLDRLRRAVAGLRRATVAVGETGGLTTAATTTLLAALKAEAPRNTGRLAGSLQARSDESGQRFYAPASAAYVVGGTRPHLILPRTKRALYWPGARHPVRRVRHPGTAPNDFPARAVERAVPALRVLLLDDGRQVIRLIKGDAA